MDNKIVPIGFVNRTCAVCGSKLYEKDPNCKIVEMALPYAISYYCKTCNVDYYIASYIADGKLHHYASSIDNGSELLKNFYSITKNTYKEVSFGGWKVHNEVSLY